MLRSGLITGAAAFVLTVIAALIAPLCGLCVGLGLGIVAGVLSVQFSFPTTAGAAARVGAGAGAIAGVGAVTGQLLAAAGLAAFFPEGMQFAAELVAEFQGAPAPELAVGQIWLQQFAIACCVGAFNVGILGALGAASAALWHNHKHPLAKKPTP